MENLHVRFIPLEDCGLHVREAGEGQAPSRRVDGRPIIFGVRSRNLTPWSSERVVYEVLEPGCIAPDLIQRSDIIFNINHSTKVTDILGRRRNGQGTLDLQLRESFVESSCDLPKTNCANDTLELIQRGDISGSYPALEELILPDCERIVGYSPSLGSSNYVNLRKIQFGTIHSLAGYFTLQPNVNLIHFEFGDGTDCSLPLGTWSPTLDSSNLQQFLSNMRQYIMLRLAQRTSTTSLTLTLSPAVYKAVYGLDADYNIDPDALAQTASLADLGITTEDLNEIEIAAGITTATKYATWLDTYRGAIYWNIGHS